MIAYPSHLPSIPQEIKTLIDTTIEYITAGGPNAEAEFRRKNANIQAGSNLANAKFPFLFQGGIGCEYYEWRMGRGGANSST